jgi:hypothetical protein
VGDGCSNRADVRGLVVVEQGGVELALGEEGVPHLRRPGEDYVGRPARVRPACVEEPEHLDRLVLLRRRGPPDADELPQRARRPVVQGGFRSAPDGGSWVPTDDREDADPVVLRLGLHRSGFEEH